MSYVKLHKEGNILLKLNPLAGFAKRSGYLPLTRIKKVVAQVRMRRVVRLEVYFRP